MTEQSNFVTLEGENINLQFETGNTYVVRGTLYFSHNTTIPEDVTLIFQGGKMVSA